MGCLKKLRPKNGKSYWTDLFCLPSMPINIIAFNKQMA